MIEIKDDGSGLGLSHCHSCFDGEGRKGIRIGYDHGNGGSSLVVLCKSCRRDLLNKLIAGLNEEESK